MAAGWFFVIRIEEIEPRLLCCFPFLGAHPCWRVGMARHLMVGLELSTLFIPIPLLIAAYGLPDPMDTWVMIWCARNHDSLERSPRAMALRALSATSPTATPLIASRATRRRPGPPRACRYLIGFETLLAVPCTLLGLLAFAVEPNCARVLAVMSTHPNRCSRFARRFCGCVRLLF